MQSNQLELELIVYDSKTRNLLAKLLLNKISLTYQSLQFLAAAPYKKLAPKCCMQQI